MGRGEGRGYRLQRRVAEKGDQKEDTMGDGGGAEEMLRKRHKDTQSDCNVKPLQLCCSFWTVMPIKCL